MDTQSPGSWGRGTQARGTRTLTGGEGMSVRERDKGRTWSIGTILSYVSEGGRPKSVPRTICPFGNWQEHI